MDNSSIVRSRQPLRNLYRALYRFASRQRSAAQTVAQRGAVKQFRDQVGSALVRAQVVDRENVGMIERACSSRLLLKSAKSVKIAAVRGGQNFDRNFAAQARVSGTVHFAHAARAKGRDDLVGTEFCAGSQRHD